MSRRLFTIGHSIADWPVFLGVLQRFGVTLLVDVRSSPRSLRFPQFDELELERELPKEGIRYLFLGEELGGRPEDPKAYRQDGLVDYRSRRKSRAFQAGIDRLLRELETNDLVMMCAEEDPLNCHRFLMICPELVAAAIEPQHIRKGGILESQQDAEDRLLRTQQLSAVASGSLFSFDRGAALETAYVAQAEGRAFRVDPRQLEPL